MAAPRARRTGAAGATGRRAVLLGAAAVGGQVAAALLVLGLDRLLLGLGRAGRLALAVLASSPLAPAASAAAGAGALRGVALGAAPEPPRHRRGRSRPRRCPPWVSAAVMPGLVGLRHRRAARPAPVGVGDLAGHDAVEPLARGAGGPG